MSDNEVLEVYERINKAIKFFDDKINASTNEEEKNILIKFKGYIKETIKDISDYVKSVFLYLHNDQINAEKGYIGDHSEKDIQRRINHNALITGLKLADNICNKYGLEPIFGNFGEFENDTSPLLGKTFTESASNKRKEISRWAIYVVTYAMTKETHVATGYIKREEKASEELTELYNCISIDDLNEMVDNSVRGM